MGFWYFLILFIGLFLVIKGILMKKPVKKISLVFMGLLCISFSIFMFSPGSAEIISDLLNLN
ncbi:high-affinity Fe2+/Pb2+ permease [Bacillus pakistanensis]|uniref:High-affinity Fe2+/Pb2+ permease n=1 Tax=Rossellomorea pakistanensis TaxID=992288 RepID=A0ABS2NDX7_9BACI|nr:high-affinity Fe2+/Pb2+ permease [Bacillus pakistanensis]